MCDRKKQLRHEKAGFSAGINYIGLPGNL